MTHYKTAIIDLLTDLFPPHEHDRWLLTPDPALNGDWPALAMQRGKEGAVYQLLLRLKQGH